MDGATNDHSGPNATETAGDRQKAPAPIETDSRLLFSSDYFRKVTKTTDIAGRLPNAVFTLPPHIVQAIVGLAEVTDATRKELVVVCKKFFLAERQHKENKVVFIGKPRDFFGDAIDTTITLDCGRLYSEGNNHRGQCGIGSHEKNVTGPRLIRIPPVLQVWHRGSRWVANTTRGLYAWGWNSFGRLGVGGNRSVMQPRRVLIEDDVLDVSLIAAVSFFRTDFGWVGCGANSFYQLGCHTDDEVTTPTPIPSSEGVTRWGGNDNVSFAFADDGLLACGRNDDGRCRVGSTDNLRHCPVLDDWTFNVMSFIPPISNVGNK